MSLGHHTARRPGWSCRGCSQPWPCAPARRRLAAEYADAPVSFALYMSGNYVEASRDLHGSGLLVDDLYDRFIAWLPR